MRITCLLRSQIPKDKEPFSCTRHFLVPTLKTWKEKYGNRVKRLPWTYMGEEREWYRAHCGFKTKWFCCFGPGFLKQRLQSQSKETRRPAVTERPCRPLTIAMSSDREKQNLISMCRGLLGIFANNQQYRTCALWYTGNMIRISHRDILHDTFHNNISITR